MVNMASLRGVIRICRHRETAPCISPCLTTATSLPRNTSDEFGKVLFIAGEFLYLSVKVTGFANVKKAMQEFKKRVAFLQGQKIFLQHCPGIAGFYYCEINGS